MTELMLSSTVTVPFYFLTCSVQGFQFLHVFANTGASLMAQTLKSAYSAGDPGSFPGSGRSPGEGNGSPLQYSCLENSMDRRAWQAVVHGVEKSDMTE